MKIEPGTYPIRAGYFPLAAVALSILFWLAESVLHAILFHGNSFINNPGFIDHVFSPDKHELWMRLTVVSAIFILTPYVCSFYKSRKSNGLLTAAVKNAEEEKNRSEAIIAGIGDGIIIQDTDYKIIYQNQQQTEKYGNRNGEYCYKVFEGRETVCDKCPVELSFLDGEVHKAERSIPTDNGTMYFELTSSPLRDADGNIIAGIKVVRDISSRKRTEEELLVYQNHLRELVDERTAELQASNELLIEEINEHRLTEDKYRSLFTNMLDGFAYHKIIVNDSSEPIDYVFLEVNKSFEVLTGLKKDDIIGKRATDVIPGIKGIEPDLIRLYGAVALTGRDCNFELYFEPFHKWYSISAYCPEIGYFVSIFEDITERKDLEKTFIEIEDRERRRIGHDLHDGLGQLLTGLAFKVRGLGRILEKAHSEGADEAADLSVLIDEAKEQASYLSRGLSPIEMNVEGLMNALKALSSNSSKMFNIPCTFTCAEAVNIHNETALTQLYRIAQEAVTNAVKYAKSSHIEISLCKDHDRIIMTIKDDGIGIQEHSGRKGGMGLKIMNYRAGLINASLEIRRDMDRGTIITCVYAGESEKKDLVSYSSYAGPETIK
jgi:PAS domain S-box-containing protein